MFCTVFVTLAVLSCTIQSGLAVEAMYEGFEQINGTDIIEFQLRVTKINRTTAALKGSVILKKPITDEYKMHINFLHSSKGNQQFNHYPMKIPPTDICMFTKNVWPEYLPYYQDFVTNCLRVDECPVEPREFRVNNHIMNGKMFPRFMPTGLWKAYLIAEKQDSDEGFGLTWTMRIYENGYFG